MIFKYSRIWLSLSSICFLSGYLVTLSHFKVEFDEFLRDAEELLFADETFSVINSWNCRNFVITNYYLEFLSLKIKYEKWIKIDLKYNIIKFTHSPTISVRGLYHIYYILQLFMEPHCIIKLFFLMYNTIRRPYRTLGTILYIN